MAENPKKFDEAKANQEFAKAVVHEKALENAKSKLPGNNLLAILFGGTAGNYFKSKALTDYADYKDLKEYGTTDPRPGKYVWQRDRAVKYFAYLSLVPLLPMTIYAVISIPVFLSYLGAIPYISDAESWAFMVLPIWSITAFIYYLLQVLVLFSATKESTIAKTVLISSAITGLAFVALAALGRNPTILVLGAIVILPDLWISWRVGLLSRVVSS